jgi:hypothetical protein
VIGLPFFAPADVARDGLPDHRSPPVRSLYFIGQEKKKPAPEARASFS